MPQPPAVVDWRPLLQGMAFWALALYLPLSRPLSRLEESLASGGLDGTSQLVLLVLSSLLLALAVGTVVELGFCWALGPGWASSLGLIAAIAGLVLSLVDRGDD